MDSGLGSVHLNMYSSTSEDEGFEMTPDGSPPGRNTKTRPNTPSPGMVPRKKGKELVFTDSGLGIDMSNNEDDTEEDPLLGTSRNIPRNADPHGRKTIGVPVVDDDDDDDEGALGSSGLSTQSNGSFARDAPSSSDPSGIGSGGENAIIPPAEVQSIFETCKELFNANRINPQNAFNLRLLDCINQMINSPGFDKSNMQLASSTVEIGTKIYVCQVDNTRSQVLALASDITLQQREHRKRKRDDGAGEADASRMDIADEEGRDSRPRSKKRVIRRRGMFVEEDNSKLLTGLEEQNVKFVSRRKSLKKKFDEMIQNELEFDYLSYFLEAGDEHPLKTGAEEANMKSQMIIRETNTNQNEMARLDFLPFNHLSEYDPETHDIWGMPLNSAEVNRAETSDGAPVLTDHDEHAYDPGARPTEYEVEGEGHALNDSQDQAQPDFNDDAEGGDGNIPAVSLHDIPSLDHLDSYFQRIRNLLNDSKSKYGWMGPKFVLPKTTWPAQARGARARKTRREPEEPEMIDFSSVDWDATENKYWHNVNPSRSMFEDETVDAWSTQKLVIPFLEIELDYDEFDLMNYEDGNDPSSIPAICRPFLSRHRSIFQSDQSEKIQRQESYEASMGPPSLGEDGFDGDNDLELARDIEDEDICGTQPMTEEGIQTQADTVPAESEWQLPGWLPGLLHDDPLGTVSGVDSIHFSRKPKPIDMGALKEGILKVLSEKLELDEWGKPMNEEETTLGLAQLMYQVLQQLGPGTEKIMSVPIFVVALMHIVAEKTLFVLYDEATDPECPMVVCKGRGWVHADHVTVPEGEFEME